MLFIRSFSLLMLTLSMLACASLNYATADAPFMRQVYRIYGPPQTSQAKQLYASLPLYANAISHPWPLLPVNVRLKPGQRSRYVPLLRTRLAITHDLSARDNTDSDLYDHAVEAAVLHFQQRHGLKASGKVDRNTLYALNISPAQRLWQLESNIPRLNQPPPVQGRYIFVNTANYQLDVFEDERSVLTMKVIVGTPARQTPTIYSQVATIVFNPAWNVPGTIAAEDIIPKIRENPSYLQENNLSIYESWRHDAKIINPNDLDWQTIDASNFPYRFKQPPGNNNALGRVKFLFPNEHAVYMHDTPSRALFSRHQRNYSSGCIRLEKPFELAEYLMRNDSRYSYAWLGDILNRNQAHHVRIEDPMPVYIDYITAWVDRYGTLQFRADVYHRDAQFQSKLIPLQTRLPAPASSAVPAA
jgi:murein L,D-transpeptidase YcbB/YkuD